jgi:hypothetical protein
VREHQLSGSSIPPAVHRRGLPYRSKVSSAGRGRRSAHRRKAPTKLSQHFDEVRPEPLIDDLTSIIELECEHERRLHWPSGRFTNKQPGACLRSSGVMKDHDHVVLGDDPADVGPEVREGLQESARGSDDPRDWM